MGLKSTQAKLMWTWKEKSYVWLGNIMEFFILKVWKMGSEIWDMK
jgi:hypothetical protein